MASCGADTEANRLLTVLTQDVEFPIPDVDLSGLVFPDEGLDTPVSPLKVTDITDGSVSGTGAFDALMRGFKAHLDVEYDSNRITGDDYTKAYIALTESAMGQSIAFLLGKDQAFWASKLVQVQAFSERIRLEIAKIEVAATQYTASNQKAAYAKTKMELATEGVTYCTAEYTLGTVLPKQTENLGYQGEMLKEQTEAQRAQTLDVRKDGAPVVGVLGKQKDLYTQQITSYQRDAELKAARIWSDAWITQKTIDEGLLPPDTLTNDKVDAVLESIRINNNLG